MFMYNKHLRLSIMFLCCLMLCGCASLLKGQVPAPKLPVLEADKIYTIPTGTVIEKLYLDKKQIGPATFPFDMKVVAPNVLIEQEEKLNNALFEKIKADEKNKTKMKIIGSIAAALGAILTALGVGWAKSKFQK